MDIKKLVFILLLSIISTMSVFATDIQLITPDTENLQDAVIRTAGLDTNYGSQTYLGAKWHSTFGIYSTYITFNISDSIIPSGQKVYDASLCLYIFLTESNSNDLSVTEVVTGWTESTITWNSNKPTLGNLINETAYSGSGEGEKYFCWNVTRWVNTEYDDDKDNVSFFLNISNPTVSSGPSFWSKEYATASLRPYLNITYFEFVDTINPSFSNNATNASEVTYNGTDVQINLTISDDVAVDFYRLSHNDTSDGSWINESLVDAGDSASVTAIFNYSIHNFPIDGGTMGWKVWANDTSNNINESDVYTFVVQDNTPPPLPLYCKKFYVGNISSGSYLFSVDCNGVVNLNNSLISNSIINTTNSIVAEGNISSTCLSISGSTICAWEEVNVSAADSLGNHTASEDLKMNGKDIISNASFGTATYNLQFVDANSGMFLNAYNMYFDSPGVSTLWMRGGTTQFGGRVLFTNSGGHVGDIGGNAEKDHIYIGLEDTNADYSLIITDVRYGFDNDFDHGTQDNPTIFIQSETNPDVNNTQWMSLTHNKTDTIIDTGSGDFHFYPAGNDSIFHGNLIADTVIDLTPAYDKTTSDALTEILNVKSILTAKGNEIDHTTLPQLAQTKIDYEVRYNCETLCMDCSKDNCSGIDYHIPYKPEFDNMSLITEGDKIVGGMMCHEFCDTRIDYQDARSLSGMVTVLTESIKELNNKIVALEEDNQLLERRLSILENQMELVMNASNITIIQSQPEFIGWYCAPEDSTRTDCRKISGSRCSLLIGWDTCVKDKVYGNWIEVYKEVK